MSSYNKMLLAALAAAPALVAAHGHVSKITVNGEDFKGFENGQSGADVVGWTTTVTDNGFVLADSLDSPDIICHRGATNAKGSVPVAAGDSVTITWDTWPESHVGPIIDYLAPCGDDCSTVDKEDLKFFKINEGGLLDGTDFRGRWVTDELIENNMAWTLTIPKDIKAGNYVLRHEIIALHEGQNPNGAQLYPQCINLEISGDGSVAPEGVSATTFYKSDDAGIAFSPYSTNLKYTIPGPALMAGGGSGSTPVEGGDKEETPAEPKPSTTLATAIRPSATGSPATPEVPAAEPTESANPPAAEPTKPANPPAENPGNGNGNGNGSGNCEVGTVSLYGQCGGKGYSGATSCAKGTCKKMNDYYSQCV